MRRFIIIIDDINDSAIIDDTGKQISFVSFYDILCEPHYDVMDVKIYDATCIWTEDCGKIGPDMAIYIRDSLIYQDDFPSCLFEDLWRYARTISQWRFQGGGVLC